MANLADTAQIIMDLYYQNYKTDEDFFRASHFQYLCGVAYSKLLEDEYKLARREARAEMEFIEIFLPQDWLIETELQLKKVPDEPGLFTAALPGVFSFPYDPYSFGLQVVRKTGNTKCNEFIRDTVRESWMNCLLPATPGRVFYYLIAGEIFLRSSMCSLDKIKVLMVPEITDASFGEDGGPVPKSKEDDIIRKTLDILIRARDGVTVDMSNNSNPNKALETELDTTFKNLRTNP